MKKKDIKIKKRIIAHLDMDAFFAAIEERDNPQFAGLAIVVGADPDDGRGRGVVSTANYKAREYGIRSAIPISIAWRFSRAALKLGKPATVFLPVDYEKYERVSENIIKIARRSAPLVEQASVDEAYLDLSFCKTYKRAENLCRQIKKEIRGREKLTCSVGIGPNKLVAKIASDMKKPDGLTVVRPEEVLNFLGILSVRKIPGIGPKTEALLRKQNVSTVSDLRKITRRALRWQLGKWGEDIYMKARGIDASPVTEEYEAKSIGEQETFSRDTQDPGFMVERLRILCKNIISRLGKEGWQSFRTAVITVRFSDFETKTRSQTMLYESCDENSLFLQALRLLLPFFDRRENPRQKKIRLVGIRIEKLK
ncbi:MAG: hypothetical protein A2667_03140 [Candidatus Wildermuthbacteria bacterium RIFCSPHIGHO2_01_FULL_47_27]|uniref:DNA polymerase IV n=2 Tax=Candidatus Wildermuthiibacteriota TaxID=1817923 RepID=A0A1G2RLY1_9BACT|nr:MAG: hypothetical protein A2667_03140 [Candidatus Wildermuthbacteria bacterium RIFCSPHIGHO2_01_FULL_47_27]OHA66960.1 MAG: hypothetical protein A3D59_01905 [Candidatus Wildermuthbacteria bacterium RIFCSPHIGHO2_02_FULL_47_17]OHA73854.1 MAG: hypothetical protein A3A32_02975 [Candidatus Wildermuthbacteria bacterium RIFCSPLOWO2_01_FULL_48_35]